MEKKDRKKILDNLKTLVSKTQNFEQMFNILKEKKVFNKYMIEEIQSNHHKVEFFYRYVTTRGPTAFKELKEALNQTGNQELVHILTHRTTVTIQGNGFNGPTLEEEYPYDQTWQVTISNERFDFNRQEVYKMDSRPKGLLLIINTRTFVNQTKEERLGSEHDVSRLESIFSQLGYKIVIPESKTLTAEDIRSEVEKFSQRKEHEDCDSSIVFVMSHGTSNKVTKGAIDIYGWDSQSVSSEDLISYFSARKCPGLRNKPKLFFFQACRGRNYQYPVSITETNEVNVARKTAMVQTESEDSPAEGKIQSDGQRMFPADYVRNTSDILIGYSTAPEYVSHRDPETGSWYIQTLCQMLAKYAATKDIQSILTLIRNCEKKKEKYEQELASTSWTRLLGLNKTFYFQPGVYGDDNLVPSPSWPKS